jgi:hypothetical protein
MAIQEQTPVQGVESLCPPIAMGQASSIPTGGEATRDDCPSRSDSLMQRFLDNLLLALSVPHT